MKTKLSRMEGEKGTRTKLKKETEVKVNESM